MDNVLCVVCEAKKFPGDTFFRELSDGCVVCGYECAKVHYLTDRVVEAVRKKIPFNTIWR